MIVVGIEPDRFGWDGFIGCTGKWNWFKGFARSGRMELEKSVVQVGKRVSLLVVFKHRREQTDEWFVVVVCVDHGCVVL